MKRRNLLKSLFIAPVIPLLPNPKDASALDTQTFNLVPIKSEGCVPIYPGIHSPHGKLHIYERGTTIPATVFWDPEMTIPHSQPIIANSQGVYNEIFLPSDLFVDFVHEA